MVKRKGHNEKRKRGREGRVRGDGKRRGNLHLGGWGLDAPVYFV